MKVHRTLMFLPRKHNSVLVVDVDYLDESQSNETVKPNRAAKQERLKKIKNYRKTLGLTKKQTAKMLGITIGTVNEREKGKGHLTDEQFKKLENEYKKIPE